MCELTFFKLQRSTKASNKSSNLKIPLLICKELTYIKDGHTMQPSQEKGDKIN